MGETADNKPPPVNEAGVRLKNGLKKALIFGGIALAATVGFSLVMMAAAPGGLMGGALMTAGASYLFPGIAASAATAVFVGVPALAAGAGFLLGATDERPILQARAENRRNWMESQLNSEEEERGMAMAARQQSIENQKHRASLIGGGFTPTAFGGATGGSGPSRIP